MPEFDLDAALEQPTSEPVMPPVNLAPLHTSELGRLLLERQKRTLFYPASWLDWQPLIRLSHLCDTFLYCDLGISLECFTTSLPGNLSPHPNLRLVDLKPIDSALFANAETGLAQKFPNEEFKRRYAPQIMGGQKAILEVRIGDCVRTITLIYLNQEGIAAYYGLYSSRDASPRVICRTDNGFMDKAGWEEPLGRLVNQSRKQPQFILDGMGHNRESDWPWTHEWQKYPDLIRDRLNGCCYSQRSEVLSPEPVELSPVNTTNGRSVTLRRGPLRPENIGNVDTVLITDIMAQNTVWPEDMAVIVLHRSRDAGVQYVHESVLFYETKKIAPTAKTFNQLADICRASGIQLKYLRQNVNVLFTGLDDVLSMRNILNKLTCFCRARGIKRIASVPFGFEHEGCELADWRAESGSELQITFYCETPGEFYSLRQRSYRSLIA